MSELTSVNVVVIDPYERTVMLRPVQVKDIPADEDGPGAREIPMDAIKEVLFKDAPITRVSGYVEHISLGSANNPFQLALNAYVDEESMFVDWDEQKFFETTSGDGPYAGRMLLYWEDAYGNVKTWPEDLPANKVLQGIVWVDAKDVNVHVPTMTTFNEDGTKNVQNLGPEGAPAYWTYDNQPKR